MVPGARAGIGASLLARSSAVGLDPAGLGSGSDASEAGFGAGRARGAPHIGNAGSSTHSSHAGQVAPPCVPASGSSFTEAAKITAAAAAVQVQFAAAARQSQSPGSPSNRSVATGGGGASSRGSSSVRFCDLPAGSALHPFQLGGSHAGSGSRLAAVRRREHDSDTRSGSNAESVDYLMATPGALLMVGGFDGEGEGEGELLGSNGVPARGSVERSAKSGSSAAGGRVLGKFRSFTDRVGLRLKPSPRAGRESSSDLPVIGQQPPTAVGQQDSGAASARTSLSADTRESAVSAASPAATSGGAGRAPTRQSSLRKIAKGIKRVFSARDNSTSARYVSPTVEEEEGGTGDGSISGPQSGIARALAVFGKVRDHQHNTHSAGSSDQPVAVVPQRAKSHGNLILPPGAEAIILGVDSRGNWPEAAAVTGRKLQQSSSVVRKGGHGLQLIRSPSFDLIRQL